MIVATIVKFIYIYHKYYFKKNEKIFKKFFQCLKILFYYIKYIKRDYITNLSTCIYIIKIVSYIKSYKYNI